MTKSSIKRVPIIRIRDEQGSCKSDAVAIEEPLEIRLEFGPAGERKVQNISVTMRTPGHDAELAVGFLYTEGIIRSKEDIIHIDCGFKVCVENKENVILVVLNESCMPHLVNSSRNFYTTSSCGVCGKGSIDAIKSVSAHVPKKDDHLLIPAGLLYQLPDILLRHQALFADTGGLHAAALFSRTGELLLIREDVGRHNALDKLIGCALNSHCFPLTGNILLLSGRASFELVQKAVMAGISIIASVGAPSSLAVELAQDLKITMVGFLRNHGFNIYTWEHRILLPVYENKNQELFS